MHLLYIKIKCMVPTVSVKSLHLEYQLWMREMIFYKEEIKMRLPA